MSWRYPRSRFTPPFARLCVFFSDYGQLLEKLGGRTRARTWDPMIKS
jgi:hypothetical protein